MNKERYLIGLCLFTASACGQGADIGDSDFQTQQSPLSGGTVTASHPEVGLVNFQNGSGSGYCTGTLIGQRWVLTAAHCVDFGTANPSAYTFSPSAGNTFSSNTFQVQRIFNLGPSGPHPEDSLGETNWLHQNATYAADNSGNNDIALLLLTRGVSPWTVPTPGTIATHLPDYGSTVTQFGFGCTDKRTFASDSLKRFASWTLNPAGSYGEFSSGGHICDGDSGGPVVAGTVDGGGPIWGVNSIGSSVFPTDTFGAVSFFHSAVCQAMHQMPHPWCMQGAAGVDVAAGCDERGPGNADQIVRSVCQEDPYCCDQAWDGFCVNEGRQFANNVAAIWAVTSGPCAF